jgi:HNH endonuclease
MSFILTNMSRDSATPEATVKRCKRGHLMTPENIAKNGKNVTCRICRSAAQNAWRAANPEKARESSRKGALKYRRARGALPEHGNGRKTHCPQGHEYTEENTYLYRGMRQCKTCRKVRVRESFARHREEHLAIQARWRAANLERHRASARDWLKNNREQANLNSRLKKQRRRNGGTLTKADWRLVLDVYGEACLACGKPEVTIDHVIPVSVGGLNVISNVQPLCGFHNTSKGTRTVDYRPFPWEELVA